MTKRSNVVALALIASGLLSGCAYYRITDTTSGKTYYTTNWNSARYGYSGTGRFLDAATGRDVTLQSFEIETIGEEEYNRHVGTPPY